MGHLAPGHMAAVFDDVLASLTRNFGWLYLWIVLGLVLFAAFLAFSRYGNPKLGAMPFGTVMSVVATVLVLVLGIMSSGGNPNPPARVKIVWGTLVAGIAISLLLAGGLKAVQTATIVFALPFTLVIVLMVIALWRAMRSDWAEQQQREREMRRRLREMVVK